MQSMHKNVYPATILFHIKLRCQPKCIQVSFIVKTFEKNYITYFWPDYDGN